MRTITCDYCGKVIPQNGPRISVEWAHNARQVVEAYDFDTVTCMNKVITEDSSKK